MNQNGTKSNKNKKLQKWAITGGIVLLVLLLLFAMLSGGIEYVAALLWIVSVLALLWGGNRFIHNCLDRFYPWMKQPFKRFAIQLFGSVFYSLACVNLAYYFLKTLLIGMPPDREQMLVLNLYGLLFIVPVISFNFGLYFMIQWKNAFIQSEKLKEENLRTRFESLKAHIDPHFLFNNINALSSLIDKDTREAHRFLDKFSEVYRYVLQHRDEELVDLETEIAFILSYTFLFQQRLNKQLMISMAAAPSSGRYCLPPLSIQMLVENAIKHNKATISTPLTIDIFLEDEEWLVVRNSFQPKNSEYMDFPKSGLENIRKRFAYFSERKVIVEQHAGFFTVKLPLLEWKEKEGED